MTRAIFVGADPNTDHRGQSDRPDVSEQPGRLTDVSVHDRLEDIIEEENLTEVEPEADVGADPEGPAPTTVVFDIGEVLIDETRVWTIWSELIGVSPVTLAAVLGAAISQGGDHRDVFPHIAPNIDWEDFVDEHERRYGGFQEGDLYPDVRSCLSELDDLGFRVVIAGNQPVQRSEQLRALALPHDVIVTSDELGAAKPDAAFFTALLARAEISHPGDALYVGDRVDNDVLPAAAFGIRTCWLRRGPWGHLQDLPDGQPVDLVLDGLGELPLLLSEWRT